MIRVFAYCFTALLFGAILYSMLRDSPDLITAIFILVGVFISGVASLGAFWMMYASYRFEKQPASMFLLAMFVPFAPVWYYFNRVRGKKLKVRRRVPTWIVPNATE